MEYFRKEERGCFVCGTVFLIKPSQLKVKGGGKYCTKICFYNRTKVALKCLVCGNGFTVSPVRRYKAKYCSKTCQYSHQMKYKAGQSHCAECSKYFYIPNSHAKRNKNTFCSKSCGAIYNRRLQDVTGNKNPSWKGGITPKHVLIRTSVRYAQWRLSVFKRDGYTCVLCGQYGGRLNADHIKAFSKYPELIFELSNGRTLCEPCHRKTENYGFKGV